MSDRLAAIDAYRAVLDAGAQRKIEHEVERNLCKTDLFYLLTVVLGRKDLNHDWLFARCREVEAAPDGYLDLWPREHYKSTIGTFGLTIQNILIDPEITIGIISFTRPIAKAFLRQIKREFEGNERLRNLFPDIIWEHPHRDAPKWSEDDGIILKRRGNPKESTIEAWGLVDGQPTSKHFRLMVYDDAAARESATNPDMVAKVIDAWAASRALGTEGGATRHYGTRWAYADLYRAIIDRGAVKERRYTVTVDGTVEGEPVLRSREWVAEKRREMGPYVFASQMLLDPAADRTQGFKEEWIRHYANGKGDHDYNNQNKYILVDAASSKKKESDYTAMAVIGLGPDENYYLLDAVRDRLSLKERGDALFALHRRWKPKGVGYERVGMMGDVEYLKERMADENYRFEITEVDRPNGVGGLPPPKSKNDRIRRMIPIFEAGRFLLPETLTKVDYEGKHVDLVVSFLNDEYRPFPVALHDDMFDAISRIWDVNTIWPKSTVQKEGRYARSRHRPRAKSFMAA